MQPYSKIYISAGDPSGIGYEMLFYLFEKDLTLFPVSFLCHRSALMHWAQWLKKEHLVEQNQAQILWLDLADHYFHPEAIGEAHPDHGYIALETLKLAQHSIEEDTKKSITPLLLTLPVHKKAISEKADPHFQGHTQWLGNAFHTPVTMILENQWMMTALVTSHIPLLRWREHISYELFQQTLLHLDAYALESGYPEEEILYTLSLNPHAGESGLLGTEERELLIPWIEKISPMLKHPVSLPMASDSLYRLFDFHSPSPSKRSIPFLSMYHDQGLIPVKLLGQGYTLNRTIGLSFPRISVDHGTAFDIVGKNTFSTHSLDYINKRYPIWRQPSYGTK